MTTHLEREINQQPYVIKGLLESEAESAQTIAHAIRAFAPTFVMIAARGTSDNAARYAQYLMGIQAGLPVALATPSIYTLYESPPKLSRALVIGISQSGQSQDIRRVIEDANQQGALTIALTNHPDSPLAQSATHHLHLSGGEEISVAATKTYTAELTAVAMIVSALLGNEHDEALHRLPGYLQDTLALSAPIPQWVQRYRYIERIAVLGRGYNYCTTFEISLKIKELCYITSEEYSEADFRHGPIAVINPGFPVIVVAPRGKPYPLMLDLLGKLAEQQAECLVVTNNGNSLPGAQYTMPIPDNMPEWLSPICAVVPGQIFAMQLAMAKGHPIDNPEGLTKVTDTR